MEESPANPHSARTRNPNWSRDETILLLDLYRKAPAASATHPSVIALSQDLNSMARRADAEPLPTFRNPAGIAMRLRNLGRYDPAAGDRNRGLRPGGVIDAQIWHELATDDERLAQEVARIRATIDHRSAPERTKNTARRSRELAPKTFDPVTAEHLLQAARMLVDGFADHPFHESTDYDVLFDGHRLPPKALLGIAAKLALNRQLSPSDFRGGRGTLCFRIIAAAGYSIIPKNDEAPREPFLSREDRRWTEGNVRLVTHLKRERGPGLAAAKRASFRAQHGRLFCERCNLDPVEHFGDADGEACIEVHHSREAVADMASGHQTELEDLECLCANCHRFVHRQMKRAQQSSRQRNQ